MTAVVADVVHEDPSVQWGVYAVQLPSGTELAAWRADDVLPVASVGKLLLLVTVAEQMADGRLPPDELLAPLPGDAVADSGLWRHLRTPALPVADLAVLVGAVSDNLATNVLLRRVGLETVAGTARRLGLARTSLLDRVRDVREPGDPPQLAEGTARELVELLTRLTTSSPGEQVLRWLRLDTDLSMVASPFGLDPLAHAEPDRGLALAHKTGTDAGVRADVGVLSGRAGEVAYAVLARFADDGDRRDRVLHDMRRIGVALRQQVSS